MILIAQRQRMCKMDSATELLSSDEGLFFLGYWRDEIPTMQMSQQVGSPYFCIQQGLHTSKIYF